jgi:hypothetical protein
MTPTKVILLCKDARESKWQLQPHLSGRLALVGWRLAQKQLEGGVPDEVASLLARALTAVALVTFPSSSEPTSAGETINRLLEPARTRERLKSVLSREPSRIFLVSTRRPEVAKSLFEDPVFPWWLQGQAVVLTPPDGPAPNLDRESILSMINEAAWPSRAAASIGGFSALIRPGVDGDVVGVAASTEVLEPALCDSIQGEAARSGFECQITSERQFAERLSRSGSA